MWICFDLQSCDSATVKLCKCCFLENNTLLAQNWLCSPTFFSAFPPLSEQFINEWKHLAYTPMHDQFEMGSQIPLGTSLIFKNTQNFSGFILEHFCCLCLTQKYLRICLNTWDLLHNLSCPHLHFCCTSS